jgi:hypothetical protein
MVIPDFNDKDASDSSDFRTFKHWKNTRMRSIEPYMDSERRPIQEEDWYHMFYRREDGENIPINW